MKKYPNILAINLMKEVKTTRQLKRKPGLILPDSTVSYRAHAAGYMLFKTSINCQMYY